MVATGRTREALDTETLALARTPPEISVTIPLMLPVVGPCARSDGISSIALKATGSNLP
jgi:hypothetical protein